jgi:hypothetical protein
VKARFVAEITEPVLMTFVESGDSTFIIGPDTSREVA